MNAKITEKAEETRKNIRLAARQLFNELGTTQVHTHDIAREAGISPGNLYYHFKNKEEIIFELFHEIEIYKESAWKMHLLMIEDDGFHQFLDFFFESINKHRYFFRDFSILLKKDETLSSEWSLRYESLFSTMEQATARWAQKGFLLPLKPRIAVETFIDTIWTLINFSFIFLETKGQISPASIHEKSINLILRFLLPYHTDKGKKEILKYMKSKSRVR